MVGEVVVLVFVFINHKATANGVIGMAVACLPIAIKTGKGHAVGMGWQGGVTMKQQMRAFDKRDAVLLQQRNTLFGFDQTDALRHGLWVDVLWCLTHNPIMTATSVP